MSLFRKSIIYSFAGQYLEILIAFISSIIISRLLTPKEVGIFSIALAISLVAHMIRDFGAGSYIIKIKYLNDSDISAAFLVNLLTSCIAAVSLYLISDKASIWLEIPELAFVIKMVSINFIIIPFGAVRLALILREMKFARYTVINSISSLVLAVVSISFASFNYGYLSLVYGCLCGTITTVLLVFCLSPSVPFFRPSLIEMKKVVSFGGKLSYINIVDTISVPFYEAVCSKFFSVSTNGLFSKGKGITHLFNKAVIDGFIPVILPHFSKITLASEINKHHTSLVTNIAAVCWPLLAIIFVLAEPILTLLFGNQWRGASVFVQWLVIINSIYILHVFNGEILTSQGLLNTQVLYKSFSLLIAFPIAYYGAVHESVALFMLAMLVQTLTELLFSEYILVKRCGIKIQKLISKLLNSFVVAILVFVFTTFIWQQLPNDFNQHLWMFLSGSLSIIFWMIIGIFLKNETILTIKNAAFKKYI